MKKKSKIDFWIKQLRRPFCGFLAIMIVVIYYSFSSFAASFSDNVTVKEYYSIDSSVTTYPVLNIANMKAYYTSEGGDSSVISATSIGSSGSRPHDWFLTDCFNNSSFAFPTIYTKGGITYDMTNAYHVFVGPYNDHNALFIFTFGGEGNFALVGNYVTSDQAFTIVYNEYYGNTSHVRDQDVILVSAASDNGFYTYNLASYMQTISFVDCPIYMPSSDGGTGFTYFSTSTTDFDFNDTNFDFNLIRANDIIIAPGDPVGPEGDMSGQHYNYGSVSHKVFGNPFDSLYYGTTIGINSYMRDYSNKYWLFTDAKIGVKFAGDNQVSEYEQNDSVPLSSFIRNGSYNYSQRLDPGLMMNGGQSLASKLRNSFENITGSQYNYTEGQWGVGSFDDEVINGIPYLDYRKYTYKGIKGDLVGSTNSKLEVAYLDLTTWFSFDGTEDDILNIDDTSGMYHVRFNLLDGTYDVLQNDVVQNLNPIEGEANLPITGGETGGNTTNNNPINISQGGISNYIGANIEYLFNLDASGLANVTANVGNTVQYVVTQISDTSENGFWAVLKRAYGVIPDPIWSWIYTTVGVLLSGAIFSWVYNGVRIKRGA